MLETDLEKYSITKAEFARYLGYSWRGVKEALDRKPKGAPILEIAFYFMLLDKKGVSLDRIKNLVEGLYQKDDTNKEK